MGRQLFAADNQNRNVPIGPEAVAMVWISGLYRSLA